jgi:oligogalacturonide lyase
VQFSPVDSRMILYNHEWPADCGIRRLWLWDGRKHIMLRTASGTRSRTDWDRHEMWQADDQFIIYHGKFADGNAFVGRVSPASGEWISLQVVDWENQSIHWLPLCEHQSFWDCQDSHPHPIFDHSDGNVYFFQAGRKTGGVLRKC